MNNDEPNTTMDRLLAMRALAGLASLALAQVTAVNAEDKPPVESGTNKNEKSLYERLGGVFAIATVIDHFSDAVVENPIVGKTSKNPALSEWHTKNLGRLPGLKFMRTL